jgi:hypothetical protein
MDSLALHRHAYAPAATRELAIVRLKWKLKHIFRIRKYNRLSPVELDGTIASLDTIEHISQFRELMDGLSLFMCITVFPLVGAPI